MGEVVGGELGLETVGGDAVGGVADAWRLGFSDQWMGKEGSGWKWGSCTGIVDQHVQLPTLPQYFGSPSANRRK